MDIVFTDSETDGLWKTGYDEFHKDQPRPVQLALARYTPDGNEIFAATVIIRPLDHWPSLTEDSIGIHGIYEDVRRSGISPISATSLLELAGFNDNVAIGGHNIGFDILVLRRFLFELGFNSTADRLLEVPSIDTMHMGINVCKLPRKDSAVEYKRPSLTELYKELFGDTFNGAHDALNDVRASARCYFELRKRGVEPHATVLPRTTGARDIELIRDVLSRATVAPKRSEREETLVRDHIDRLAQYGDRFLTSDKAWSWLVVIANRVSKAI